MKNLCLIFLVHQPFRLKNFHFFEIGQHHNYYDEQKNKRIIRLVAEESYLPTNTLLLKLFKKYGDRIKISFAISGTALDQMELYTPKVLASFKDLANTDNIEFLAYPYSASLASMRQTGVFKEEVVNHKKRIQKLFGKTPKVFLNTALIYSDEIGKKVADMGFKGMIAEGCPALLGVESPNQIYTSAVEPSLKLLLRNPSLSDDITLRFSRKNWSEWPLTADKYMGWLQGLSSGEEVVNLVMDYNTFGERHKKETGIFNFFEYLLHYLAESEVLNLSTPKEVLKTFASVGGLNSPSSISWAGRKQNLSLWLGNEMQQEAFDILYRKEEEIHQIKDMRLCKDWTYLQSADHFLYMNNEDENIGNRYNPYEGPYEAFMKYMNVLSDLELRIQEKITVRGERVNMV